MTLRLAPTLAWVSAPGGLFALRCDTEAVPVHLDGPAAAILAAADGAATPEEVVRRVAADTGEPAARISRDVASFLSLLVDRGYVVDDRAASEAGDRPGRAGALE